MTTTVLLPVRVRYFRIGEFLAYLVHGIGDSLHSLLIGLSLLFLRNKSRFWGEVWSSVLRC